MASDYALTLDWLLHLEARRGWDLKLESVRQALERFGSPERDLAALHVAGTNGKGSAAAIAHSVLSAAGLRVGLFTSPHLSDFRERIRIGAQWIAADDVVALVEEIRERLAGTAIELTFFELTTVLAFVHFQRSGVDAAVVEVGLGGRLDATNVLHPRATAVTTIAFDHERYLGTSFAAIAAEKGGIFKAGVAAVVGRVDEEAGRALAGIAAARGSPLSLLGREFRAEPAPEGFDYAGRRTLRGLRPGLRGRFQIDNSAVALAALEAGGWLEAIDDATVRRGVAEVVWPGRLEIVRESPRVVLDGAHNPAGVAALAEEVPALAAGRPVHLVFGVLGDKRWTEMVETIAPLVADAAIVPVGERRSEDPDRVAAAFRKRRETTVAPSGIEAVGRLLRDPRVRDHVILVAGSLFLVGEVRAHLLG